MHRLSWPWLAALSAVAAFSVTPLNAAPAPQYQTLLDALPRSPLLAEGDALHDAALARARQARALPNPTLSLDGEGLYGNGSYRDTDRADVTLSLRQPLELWGQRRSRIEAAMVDVEHAALRREQLHSDAAGSLAALYADAEASIRRHALAEEALQLTQADAEAIAVLVREGREARLRDVQARSEVATARAERDSAFAALQAALARLGAAAGLNATPSSVTDSLLDRTPPDVDAADEADRTVLAVRLAEAEERAAQAHVERERRSRRPAVEASMGIQRFEDDDAEAFSVGLSVELPLFDRGRGHVETARAEQRASAARLQLRRQQVNAERAAADAALRAAGSRIDASDAGVAAADEAYRLARIGFEAGRITQLELRSARAALIAARHAAIDARLMRVAAEIERARLQGRVPFGS